MEHAAGAPAGQLANAIIIYMGSRPRSIIKTGGGVDLAFAIVVLASYFATFSGFSESSTLDLVLMIVIGMVYLTLGIYGYGFCARVDQLSLSITYFAIQAILGAWIIYLGKGAGFNAMVLLPLAGHAVVLLPQRLSYVINAVILLAYVAAVYLFSNGDLQTVWNGLPIFLAGLVFIVVFTQMAVGEEKARSEVERLVGELTAANQRLREFVSQVEELTVARERNRLAREIHDGLGHYLTTIHMQIMASRAVLSKDADRADEMLEKAQHLTQEALIDVRKSVGTLRSNPEESMPLRQMIESLSQSAEVQGVDVHIQVVGQGRELSPSVKLTLFRAAQEGINNACKHGHASNIWIVLDFSNPSEVRFSVQDDGVGSEKTDGGFGLIGLQERVSLLGGEFSVQSAKGKGFQFEMVVPG